MQEGGFRFFFEFEGKRGLLSEEETHHLVNVLRKKQGEIIKLINGKGCEFSAEIIRVIKRLKKAEVEIKALIRKEPPPSKEIISILPILKGGKTEFLVEKGTELGITCFVPFKSEFTVVKVKENLISRFEAKVLSALKQSGRLWKPVVNPPVELRQFLQKLKGEKALKLCAEKDGEPVKNLYHQLKETGEKYDKIYLLSGPEGGFSKNEKLLIEKAGFLKINFSPYVLRAETAVFALFSLAMFL